MDEERLSSFYLDLSAFFGGLFCIVEHSIIVFLPCLDFFSRLYIPQSTKDLVFSNAPPKLSYSIICAQSLSRSTTRACKLYSILKLS